MSTEFEWTSPESDQEAGQSPPDRPTNKRWPWMLALLIVLCGCVLVLLYRASRSVDEELLRAVELYVEAEKRAVDAGDGTIFFSMQDDDPAWRASQIQLARDLAQTEKIKVTHVQTEGDYVWVTLRSMMGALPIYRQAFFRRSDARLIHAESDPSFWGPKLTHSYSWGKLRLHRADSEWGEMIGEFVAAQVEALCRDGCVERRQPFTLILSSDYETSATEGEIRIPSPRLIGLNGAGRPSPLFWKRLANELDAHLRPAAIRFAAPDEVAGLLQARAAEFTTQHPDISVEIVPLSQLPADLDEMLTAVDGAYLQPTPSLIASAHIHDLTSLAETDPRVELEDFYEPILAATKWRGRLWALPLSAEIRLIYFDEPSFESAALSPENYLSQIWQHTVRPEADQLSALHTESEGWGFLDSSVHTLYAYAFAQRCAAESLQPCTEPLSEDDLAAALTWYCAMVVQEGAMPDFASMDEDERRFWAVNLLSVPRTVPMWVDLPAFYEHTGQIGDVGVLPLRANVEDGAGSGPTPLQLHSGVISRSRENPVAVWKWLTYLSHQRPIGPARSIPARHSVAQEIEYWETLPPELRGPMSEAFRVARPVGIVDRAYFGWSALDNLVNGGAEAEALAEQMMETIWFQFD